MYTGLPRDYSTGLIRMGARWYDPTLGRFTQADPSGQETNPYLYAAGNPINSVDLTGLSALGAIASSFVGSAIGSFFGRSCGGNLLCHGGAMFGAAAAGGIIGGLDSDGRNRGKDIAIGAAAGAAGYLGGLFGGSVRGMRDQAIEEGA